MYFKCHNVLLPDGKKTLNNKNLLLSDSLIVKSIKDSIKNFIHCKEYKKLRAIDLACMEGGYSIELAKMGFQTIGIDARKENIIKANYLKLILGLNNLNFIKDDVRNITKYGSFDLTLCLGILYHLDNPFEFLKDIYKSTNRILILHTFYVPEDNTSYRKNYEINSIDPENSSKNRKEFLEKEFLKEKHIGYIQHIKNYKLEPDIIEYKDYKGSWFNEWEEGTNQEKLEEKIFASYNNNKSFWFCKKDLLKALYDVGFNNIYEQYDDIGDLGRDSPEHYYPRTLLICIKK